jgi:signal transduction histidine kinase
VRDLDGHVAELLGDRFAPGRWQALGDRAAADDVGRAELLAWFGALRAALHAAITGAPLDPALARLERRVDQALVAALRGHAARLEARLPMAALAHEVRGPLTALQLNLQLIARQAHGGDVAGVADRIELLLPEVRRLARLLGDVQLVTSTHLVTGDHDLVAIVRGAVDLEAIVANQREVAIQVDAPAPARIECDRDRVHQLVGNLVRNAIEAATRWVVVEVCGEADGAAIAVRDDGAGFPPQVLARVGQPFVTTKPGGTGLGIAVARHLASIHGGSVTARNRGGGAEVVVRLPRRPT